jgi:hypothetical protein
MVFCFSANKKMRERLNFRFAFPHPFNKTVSAFPSGLVSRLYHRLMAGARSSGLMDFGI